jgi:sugar/nucleoside kinase (ribokinase family)
LASLDDLKLLSGLDDPSARLDCSHRQGAGTVVLKMGRDGAWVSADGTRTRVAAALPTSGFSAVAPLPAPERVFELLGAGS